MNLSAESSPFCTYCTIFASLHDEFWGKEDERECNAEIIGQNAHHKATATQANHLSLLPDTLP